jgi:hypothetical protein
MYPEHKKLISVVKESQTIGEFLEWCYNNGKFLAEYRDNSPNALSVNKSIDQILADYFNIDLKVIEQEKRAMLKELRNGQKEESHT